MGELRWALLILGGVLIGLLYVWSVWIKPRLDASAEVWGEASDADAAGDVAMGDVAMGDVAMGDVAMGDAPLAREPSMGDFEALDGLPSKGAASSDLEQGDAGADDSLADDGSVPVFLTDELPEPGVSLSALEVDEDPALVAQLEQADARLQADLRGWNQGLASDDQAQVLETATNASKTAGSMEGEPMFSSDLVARREARLGLERDRGVAASADVASDVTLGEDERWVARETSEGLYELHDGSEPSEAAGLQPSGVQSTDEATPVFAADPEDSPFRFQDQEDGLDTEAGTKPSTRSFFAGVGSWLGGLGGRVFAGGAKASAKGKGERSSDGGGTRDDASDGPELILVMFVVSPPGRRFSGEQIRFALEASGLVFGEMDVFHRMGGEADRLRPVFSVADMLEPGHLRFDDERAHQTPGLTVFMRLPGPKGAFDAFDDMVNSAGAIAQRLGGELRDRQRAVLTAQTLEHMREQVAAFVREQRLSVQRRARARSGR